MTVPDIKPQDEANRLMINARTQGLAVIDGLQDLLLQGHPPHVVTAVAESTVGGHSAIAISMVVRAAGLRNPSEIRSFVTACHSGSYGRRQMAAPGTGDVIGQNNLVLLENLLGLPHGVLSALPRIPSCS